MAGRLDRQVLKAVATGPEWRVTDSPLQLGLGGCPWRVAVASVLLNRTSHVQVRPALHRLLMRWPTARHLAAAKPWDVAEVVAGCGLQNRRSRLLVAMSQRWLSDDWTDARDLPGFGPYVSDAVGLFCLGDVALESKDVVLWRYVREKGAGGAGSRTDAVAPR
jgi:adenine-specific DNA glycosylase